MVKLVTKNVCVRIMRLVGQQDGSSVSVKELTASVGEIEC